MFAGNVDLKQLTLNSSFNTQNVTNIYGMFLNCNKLESLKLPSSFNTKKFTNMEGMFYNFKNFDTFSLFPLLSIDKKIVLKSPY